jgi:hypothetical protein
MPAQVSAASQPGLEHPRIYVASTAVLALLVAVVVRPDQPRTGANAAQTPRSAERRRAAGRRVRLEDRAQAVYRCGTQRDLERHSGHPDHESDRDDERVF